MSVSRMLGPHAGLGLYASELQPGLLREADAYYEAEAARAMAALDVQQYLLYAEELLSKEHARVEDCLDAGISLRPLRSIGEQRLLASHAATILDRGFIALLDGCRGEDLRRLYSLLKGVRRVDDVRQRFADRTRARFVDIVAEKDDEKDKRVVAELLDYKASMDRCVPGCCKATKPGCDVTAPGCDPAATCVRNFSPRAAVSLALAPAPAGSSRLRLAATRALLRA